MWFALHTITTSYGQEMHFLRYSKLWSIENVCFVCIPFYWFGWFLFKSSLDIQIRETRLLLIWHKE